MSKAIGLYPSLAVDASGSGVVSRAGTVVLVDTATKIGLDRALSVALSAWRHPNTVHDPGKIVCDLAIALAIGGDCLADVFEGLADGGRPNLASYPTYCATDALKI